jgi:hypothetical protein
VLGDIMYTRSEIPVFSILENGHGGVPVGKGSLVPDEIGTKTPLFSDCVVTPTGTKGHYVYFYPFFLKKSTPFFSFFSTCAG